MSFDGLIYQTCTVKRYSVTGTDDYGNPVKNWEDYLTNVACRLTTTKGDRGRELKSGAEVVIANYKLFIDKDIDIIEQDRVVMSDGIQYEVLLVQEKQGMRGQHHKECYLQTVR